MILSSFWPSFLLGVLTGWLLTGVVALLFVLLVKGSKGP